MALAHSWRVFRRMQHTTLTVAALTYAGAALEAWRLPGAAESLKLDRTAVFPGLFLVLSAACALSVPVLRRAVVRHLWTSYRTGFGQSVISVLVGFGVLIALAGVIVWRIHEAAVGGGYPGGAFSGYAAGIGLLIAQSVLVRRIERDPGLRRLIEEP
jgi:hypothetical protein